MTKKHFVAIAAIIHKYGSTSGSSVMSLAWELAKYFAITNKLFDKDRFFIACGLRYEKEGEYEH